MKFIKSSLSFRVITQIEDLEVYSEEWNQINAELPHQNPLMSYEWIVTFLEGLSNNNHEWSVVVVTCNGNLVAVLPLVISTATKFGFRIQQLELPFNDQTMSVDILIKKDLESLVFNPLIKFVFNTYPKTQVILLRRVDQRSNLMGIYKSFLFTCVDYCEDGASLEIPENYSEFRSSLGKNFKSNLNKANNKIKKIGGATFIDGRTSGMTPHEMLNLVADMEDTGWKGRACTSIKSSSVDYDFYEKLVIRLNETNNLYFHFLEVDGEIVAGNLGVLHGKKVLLWKLAYNESCKKYSPGGVLLEYLIQKHAGDNDINTVDLMTNESWYNNWNMNWRPFQTIYLFKPGLLGLYLYCLTFIKILAKKIFKK